MAKRETNDEKPLEMDDPLDTFSTVTHVVDYMSATKSFATKIDWTALSTKLKPDTLAAINNFRRRHVELTKTLQELKEQPTTIDFQHYRNVLHKKQSKAVVDNAEKALASFAPSKYDLTQQLQVIEQHQAKAVAAAKATASQVNTEMVELNALLKDIEAARPVEQLTVDDVAKALPSVDVDTAKMAKRGQWIVPGYYEKFGEFKLGF